MHSETSPPQADAFDFTLALLQRWRLLVVGPLAIGVATLGASYLITPTFTARTSFLPPQQQQSAAASALASLGGLSSILGGAAGGRTPADQYVSLLQSTTVADHLIDKFDLLKVYDKEFRLEARKELAKNSRMVAGKKDGIIVVEVDDESPARAAEMANRYVGELRVLTNRLALTEAQQRRVFFEGHLQRTREHLAQAQLALQASGFNQASLKAEPKAAAEGYAKLKAEVTTAQARLDSLRRNLTESATEVQQAGAGIAVLKAQLALIEATATQGGSPDYVGKYREFKYQEALFEQFSRQYELARVDESREGLLQVIDVAQPPEKKSWPKRALMAIAGTVAGFIMLLSWVLASHRWQQAAAQPGGEQRMDRLRAAFRRQ
ncbi:MAG: Wzz/FepE/Etk N-terminal domain-containing protein [Rubrivivax sp.]|nr:Wzz/FepE/Etk N-terminal domain-containing protein [Rubrivivax sp.]